MSKKDKNTNLSFREQIKPIFEERFKEMLGSDEEYLKFVNCILTPQRKSFRINTYKCENPNKVKEEIENKEIKLIPVPWSKNAYFTQYSKDDRTDLGNLFEHFMGKIYVQEATSMCPVEVIDIPENIDEDFYVLDVAAAPGSKTTQLGEKMKNNGILVANELDYSRIGALKNNLERSGFANVVITNSDGVRIEGEEKFDRVLLDAPCSGSGVIRKSPKTIKMYNPKKLKSLNKLQLNLLKRSFGLLKTNGIMTYSTCSLDPEENEFCIQKFLEETPNAKLEEVNLNGITLNNKLKEFQGIKIDSKITEKTVRIWPQDNDTNGFYIAKIKKLSK